MGEDGVRHILMSEKLPKILSSLEKIVSFLEKDGSIECILLLYLNKGRWKEAKEFLESVNSPIKDGIFRSRMFELEHLKISRDISIDLKKHYQISEFGKIIANLIIEYFEKFEPYF